MDGRVQHANRAARQLLGLGAAVFRSCGCAI
jgi:hypothetical protein